MENSGLILPCWCYLVLTCSTFDLFTLKAFNNYCKTILWWTNRPTLCLPIMVFTPHVPVFLINCDIVSLTDEKRIHTLDRCTGR